MCSAVVMHEAEAAATVSELVQTWRTEGAMAVRHRIGLFEAVGEEQAVEVHAIDSPSPKSMVSDMEMQHGSGKQHQKARVDSEEESGPDVHEESMGSDKSILSWSPNDSGSSDSEDELVVEKYRTWTTAEDKDRDRIEHLKLALRQRPLLPEHLRGWKASSTQPDTGIKYPAMHCAFRNCSWCSEMSNCEDWLETEGTWKVEGKHWRQSRGVCCQLEDRCLFAHLWSVHRLELQHTSGSGDPKLAFAVYMAGIEAVELDGVPSTGWSVDRRTLRQVHEAVPENECGALICACCACVRATGSRSEIAYVSVQSYFGHLSEKSFVENWCWKTYLERYGSHPAVQRRIGVAHEWDRLLPHELMGGRTILCCPEDIHCEKDHRLKEVLCLECQLPLCRSCLEQSQGTTGIPAALGNDNWLGYPLQILYDWKVRWVEAALASPLWTAMIHFYLEEDRGHLMEEELHRAEFRIGIRGNISSFSIPWEEVYEKLQEIESTRGGIQLPHSPEVLATMVRFTLKAHAHADVVEWVRGAKVRPWVVLKLLEHLIDIGHPMCASHDAERLRNAFAQRVAEMYGVAEAVPTVIVEAIRQEVGVAAEVPHAKHATPEAAPVSNISGEAFTGELRPHTVTADHTSTQAGDAEVMEVTALSANLHHIAVTTGAAFFDQWQSRYLSYAFPYSLPAPLGGPDFPQKRRDRRGQQAPLFTSSMYMRSLVARAESSIRNSWDLIPGVRRITSKWQAVWKPHVQRQNKSDTVLEPRDPKKWVEAAARLYKRLRCGRYKQGESSRPINYDTRKLWQAEGITEDELSLLRDVRARQQMLAGTVETRKRIGRYLFGARVELGEPLFVTVSPTTRHNGLYLRFVRYRAQDPAAKDMASSWFEWDKPHLWQNEAAAFDLPQYEVRRVLTARDPWATVQGFQYLIRFVFSCLLGLRACFACPQCNCRDRRGRGAKAGGGIFGLVRGFCGAIEYQRNSAPHFHGHVYVANIWQKDFQALVSAIEAKLVSPESIFKYHAWLHRECHFDVERHMEEVTGIEHAWLGNFVGKEQDDLCLWPSFVVKDVARSPWLSDRSEDVAVCDGRAYILAYQQSVQRRWSHFQNHVHPWNVKEQKRLPLASCARKGQPKKCKHRFPKCLNPEARVICPGNARKYGLSSKGQRSALGMVLNKRDDEWLSGTSPALSLMLSGNTHTAPNFRVPLMEATHDRECLRNCHEGTLFRKLLEAMRRAAQRCTKYFTGYMQKAQPLGKKEFDRAAKQLSFLETAQNGAVAGYYRIVNRIMSDLEFRCSVRPVTEEFMLAGFHSEADPASAECIRTFPVTPFLGLDLVKMFEKRTRTVPLAANTFFFWELYGWRGKDERIYWLSPWEFTKYWCVEKLQAPKVGEINGLSQWTDKVSTSMPKPPAGGWKFGVHFEWKEVLPVEIAADIVRVPRSSGTQQVPDVYFFRRRKEPVVPYPVVCPLPKQGLIKKLMLCI